MKSLRANTPEETASVERLLDGIYGDELVDILRAGGLEMPKAPRARQRIIRKFRAFIAKDRDMCRLEVR